MIDSTPAAPARTETPLRTAGGQSKNPNYARIVNSHANECCASQRRDAIRRDEADLAEGIAA